jgi:hypothetical protein
VLDWRPASNARKTALGSEPDKWNGGEAKARGRAAVMAAAENMDATAGIVGGRNTPRGGGDGEAGGGAAGRRRKRIMTPTGRKSLYGDYC